MAAQKDFVPVNSSTLLAVVAIARVLVRKHGHQFSYSVDDGRRGKFWMMLQRVNRQRSKNDVVPGLARFADTIFQAFGNTINKRFIWLLLRKKLKNFYVRQCRYLRPIHPENGIAAKVSQRTKSAFNDSVVEIVPVACLSACERTRTCIRRARIRSASRCPTMRDLFQSTTL